MKARIILTVLGSDRPGLTQELADAVLHVDHEIAGADICKEHLGREGAPRDGEVLHAREV